MDDIILLSDFLKSEFGGKVAKISLNGGFTCPNRLNGNKGCLFCTDTGAGEFSGNAEDSIQEQFISSRHIMDKKWNRIGYIAYFQNFTNTYGSLDKLKKVYNEALSQQDVLGLAVATRPDCLDDKILDLLSELNQQTFLWIELGFQTSNENTAEAVNRGYANNVFKSSILKLHDRNIKTVAHLIAGLPGEDKTDFLNSVRYLNDLRPWGIKFHSIYIQDNSPLLDYSIKTGFRPIEMYDYIDWLTDALLDLDKGIIIHRLTGDPDKGHLVSPLWPKDKLRVLSEIKRIYNLKNNLSSRS